MYWLLDLCHRHLVLHSGIHQSFSNSWKYNSPRCVFNLIHYSILLPFFFVILMLVVRKMPLFFKTININSLNYNNIKFCNLKISTHLWSIHSYLMKSFMAVAISSGIEKTIPWIYKYNGNHTQKVKSNTFHILTFTDNRRCK